jgi:hypothetical protein
LRNLVSEGLDRTRKPAPRCGCKRTAFCGIRFIDLGIFGNLISEGVKNIKEERLTKAVPHSRNIPILLGIVV